MGHIYKRTWKDKQGNIRQSPIWWVKYYRDGRPFYESSQCTKESKGNVRFLTEEEEKALLNAADEPLRTIIQAGIYAGVRVQSEALTLIWDNIDFENGFLTVQDAYAKSGETRTVPLESGLSEALLVL